MKSDLDRFYRLLGVLEFDAGLGAVLGDCTGRQDWPSRGIYFFREPGEYRSTDPSTARVTRIGTHAVSSGANSKLWQRLRAHRGHRDGGGNHRGSIFRLHVGAALLKRDGGSDDTLRTWGRGSSAPRDVRLGKV